MVKYWSNTGQILIKIWYVAVEFKLESWHAVVKRWTMLVKCWPMKRLRERERERERGREGEGEGEGEKEREWEREGGRRGRERE